MWRRGLWRGRRVTFNTSGGFAWQAWCTSIDVEAWRHSGTDVAPRSLAWQACHFQHLGLDLRGRRGTPRCQRKLGDILGLMWRRGLLRGRRVSFNTSGSICVAGVLLSAPP